MKKIILASRGSALALKQTEAVKAAIEKTGCECEILIVKTRGDKNQLQPLSQLGGNGLFVREIEAALLNNEADIAVHSAKDLPVALAQGLTVGGVLEAESYKDCLVLPKGESLKKGSIIGTSSTRRTQMAGKFFPFCRVSSVRGNVDTRLNKLKAGEYDALILARAGLNRLKPDLSDFEVRDIDDRNFIPAANQGIIAMECRQTDEKVKDILNKISHDESFLRFKIQTYMLSLLNADCKNAVGVLAQPKGESVKITAYFEGKISSAEGNVKHSNELCKKILHELMTL